MKLVMDANEYDMLTQRVRSFLCLYRVNYTTGHENYSKKYEFELPVEEADRILEVMDREHQSPKP